MEDGLKVVSDEKIDGTPQSDVNVRNLILVYAILF
jgi:hypothetical protein